MHTPVKNLSLSKAPWLCYVLYCMENEDEDEEKCYEDYEHDPQYAIGDFVQLINPEDDEGLEYARGYPEEIEDLTLLSVEVCKIYDRDNFIEAIEEIMEVCNNSKDHQWRYMTARGRVQGFAERILERNYKQYKAKVGNEIYFLHWCPEWNCFTTGMKALR